jgi:hypothetical protein
MSIQSYLEFAVGKALTDTPTKMEIKAHNKMLRSQHYTTFRTAESYKVFHPKVQVRQYSLTNIPYFLLLFYRSDNIHSHIQDFLLLILPPDGF